MNLKRKKLSPYPFNVSMNNNQNHKVEMYQKYKTNPSSGNVSSRSKNLHKFNASQKYICKKGE